MKTKEDLNDKLWLVVRSLKSSGEKIVTFNVTIGLLNLKKRHYQVRQS
jgi:hypothetical protein